MTNAAEAKVAWIEEQLAAGRTVYLTTALRVTPITPKNAARFADAGRPLVKVGSDGVFRLWERGSYVDASGCKITAS